MAQKVIKELVDDIDGTEATQTIPFSLDGIDYEIDLNDEHAEELRESLSEYVDNARRSGSGRHVKRHRTNPRGNGAVVRMTLEPDPKTVREWAKGRNKQVPPRGRLPKALIEEFKRTHKVSKSS